MLTSAPPIAFEETGGSSSGRKIVPYTQASLDSFRSAVLPWLSDLLSRRPLIAEGRAYVSISPATRAPSKTAGGRSIGLGSDADYLGPDLAQAFGALVAVPPDVGAFAALDAWREATLRHLVACENLSFVSVWSPTFFLELVESIPSFVDSGSPQLGEEARTRLAAATAGGALDTRLLWPKLDTISCWVDGASKPFADRLNATIPHAHIDPKGLLATEAPVTIGWSCGRGAIPALTSVFIEFVGVDGQSRLADELVEGETYSVVITTWGGLYRYDLGDEVQCVGFCGPTPLLAFVGRNALCSDLVGEKLTDAFAARILAQIPATVALAAVSEGKPHYELWLDAGAPLPSETLARIEQGLCGNPQYAYARDLCQLGPLSQIVRPGFCARLVDLGLGEGRRLGDIKAAALLTPQQRNSLIAHPPDPRLWQRRRGHTSTWSPSNSSLRRNVP